MENISTSAGLKEAILLLEAQKSLHYQEMREKFFLAYENLKPANLIESTIKEIGSSPLLFNNVLKVAIGLVAGYFSKKALLASRSNKKSLKLLGQILQFSITNLVVYTPDGVKLFIRNLLSKKKIKSG